MFCGHRPRQRRCILFIGEKRKCPLLRLSQGRQSVPLLEAVRCCNQCEQCTTMYTGKGPCDAKARGLEHVQLRDELRYLAGLPYWVGHSIPTCSSADMAERTAVEVRRNRPEETGGHGGKPPVSTCGAHRSKGGFQRW